MGSTQHHGNNWYLLDWKATELIKKSTSLDLMEHNTNHTVPLFWHPLISQRVWLIGVAALVTAITSTLLWHLGKISILQKRREFKKNVITTHPWVPVTPVWRVPWVADGRVGLQWIFWIGSRGQPTRSGAPAWGFSVRLTTSHCKTHLRSESHTGPRNWIDLGRPRRRWEDNIRMDLEEIGINAGNWSWIIKQLWFWKPRNWFETFSVDTSWTMQVIHIPYELRL